MSKQAKKTTTKNETEEMIDKRTTHEAAAASETSEPAEMQESDETKAEETEILSPEEQRIMELEAQVIEKENLAKDYLDKLQRTLAEYDNFRKRTVKEKSTMYENGAREVLEKILPVLDNFDRAIQSIPEESKESALAQGIEMVYKQLSGSMKDLGVEEIEAVGNEFDPNLHHAVAHEENEEHGANEVIEVFQKGYIYKDRTLRCSMVKVAN